jgi:hypothetical protein
MAEYRLKVGALDTCLSRVVQNRVAVHDFFQPQPFRQGATFFLRSILHDWSDKYASQILTALRAGVGDDKDSKVVIIDNLVPYGCRTDDVFSSIPGGIEERLTGPIPEILLPNLGAASWSAYWADLHVCLLISLMEKKNADCCGYADAYDA